MSDEDRPGHPNEVSTLEIIEKVYNIVINDPRRRRGKIPWAGVRNFFLTHYTR